MLYFHSNRSLPDRLRSPKEEASARALELTEASAPSRIVLFTRAGRHGR